MTIAVMVQARLSSQQVPGKVLRPVAGQPLLGYVLERASRAASCNGNVIVATSVELEDDPIESYCRDNRYQIYRGRRDDVARRLVAAADMNRVDVIVRLSGDQLLVDQAIIDRAVAIFLGGGADLVTNVSPRSYPDGMTVEVMSREMLTWALRKMTTPAHHEQVTSLFYEQPDLVRIENFSHDRDLSHLKLTVDTEADLEHMERLFAAMNEPHWTYPLNDVVFLSGGVTPAAH